VSSSIIVVAGTCGLKRQAGWPDYSSRMIGDAGAS